MVIFISILWCLLRALFGFKRKRLNWKREAQLLLVYICIVVVVRFTFFPFSTVNGEIQPLVFDPVNAFPFRVNWIPFVYLLDYPGIRDIIINVIGNTAMFIPLGVIWPFVYRELNTAWKAFFAGFGVSLCIELLQLPFYTRVSDVDDLILNTVGFMIGYLLYLLIRLLKQGFRRTPKSA